ncbi:Cof-type HAD-IIB family hydrolase [Anoxybacterium hadale]|uniref:Cof-type HAD-IIB family hydrolase n=1 Tax=Anoxybacterium hadale TaxID=3408580 RepID=A0ACD1A618_9FIRM|nr:Cof-type HAD-IIB family hydrolase [Clostridiales bacterium]
MRTGIFFDIDGTLRDANTFYLPETTAGALQKLREQGYFLAIATGRIMYEISNDIRDLIDWDAFVCSNGQAIYTKKRELLNAHYFSKDLVNHCIEVSHKAGMPLYLTTEGGPPFITEASNETIKEVCSYFKMKVPPTKPYENETILSMMAFGKSDEDFADFENMDEIELLHGHHHFADVVLSGFSKHKGIEAVMQNFDIKEYIAFGDSLNDYEMLKNANISVAMGDSHPDLITIVDFHTNKVSEDGVMRACKYLKLIG